jgi:hypothetical protein
MAYRDLHGFLDKLEELGEIERDEAVVHIGRRKIAGVWVMKLALKPGYKVCDDRE